MKVSLTRLVLLLFFAGIAKPGAAQNKSGLIPDYVVIQHAGSIGYFSGGAGYDLFYKDRGYMEFLYGKVPGSKGGPLNIVTAKFAYRAFDLEISDKIKVHPFNPGVFFSYHLDDQFDITFDEEQYGKSYYGWSTAVRAHISVSNELKMYAGNTLKSVTLYSEFNTSDLYLASLFYKNNRDWLRPEDIIKLGIGIKVGF